MNRVDRIRFVQIVTALDELEQFGRLNTALVVLEQNVLMTHKPFPIIVCLDVERDKVRKGNQDLSEPQVDRGF